MNALVRMAQDFLHARAADRRSGQFRFGDGDPPAAMRSTERAAPRWRMR